MITCSGRFTKGAEVDRHMYDVFVEEGRWGDSKC